jgi:tetratricopeptide (TPR) repeat protein
MVSAQTRNAWILLLGLLLAPPAWAQGSPTDKRASLDKLFAALQAAPEEGSAQLLEGQIRDVLLNSGTPAVTLLMSRGVRELRAGANQDAIEDFGDAIVLDPKLAEAYHQRAVARFAAGDTPGAIVDLEATLKQEPRDFAALKTLANIAESHEDWKGAYAAWQKLLEIDPKTPGGEERLKDLRRRALGDET